MQPCFTARPISRQPNPSSEDAGQPPLSTAADAAETDTTMITFKSVGHFFATAFTALAKDIPKVEGTEATVEAVTAAAGGAVAVPRESAASAVLGEGAAVITAGGSAASSKLADAGLDVAVIQKVEAVIANFPNIVTLAKAL